jgi:hypothetical protein
MCIWERVLTGGDGRVSSPRRHSISRGFAPIPPFYPRRRSHRLHPFALTPGGYGADGAVRRRSVHASALHVVERPREINRVCPAAAPSGCRVGKPVDTWTGWNHDSGHAQFQLFAERLERSRNAVDARAMTDIGQSRDLLRGRVQPTRQIGGTHPLAHHFIQ